MLIQNLSYFVNGACFMFLLFEGISILQDEEMTRIKRVLGYITCFFAVWTFKDILLCFSSPQEGLLYKLIVCLDGWSALAYAILLLELPMRGCVTLRRLLIATIPFFVFTVWFIISPTKQTLTIYLLFLFVGGWIVMIFSIVMSVRYYRYIRKIYSNVDDIDFSWFRIFFPNLILVQLLWVMDAIWPSPVLDSVYYICFVAIWYWTIRLIRDMKDLKVIDDNNEDVSIVDYPFAGKLEHLIIEQQLYKKSNLTLYDLIVAVNTNRTYLSSYFNNVLHSSFYDYINRQRIERVALPLMKEKPMMTLEAIASESGFNSISTFRRAFVKVTGCTPSKYEEQ